MIVDHGRSTDPICRPPFTTARSSALPSKNMSDPSILQPLGGYRFLKGGSPYSAGAVAEPGLRIHRAQLPRPLSLSEGFARIREHLDALGRPPQALCAIELRSPAPFTYDGFGDFNRQYVELLKSFALHVDGINPVARTNVAPDYNAPTEPGIHAFCYTVPGTAEIADFVVAGGGEIPGDARGPEAIIRLGDTSPEAMADKAAFVMGLMRERLDGLGVLWTHATATRVYCVHDIYALMPPVLHEVTDPVVEWHYSRPPVIDIEFEMDVRRTAAEHTLS